MRAEVQHANGNEERRSRRQRIRDLAVVWGFEGRFGIIEA